MTLVLILLLAASFGGAFLTARRWVRTGSSARVFPWVAGLVFLWPVLMLLGGGSSSALAFEVLKWLIWSVVAVLIVLLGKVVADEALDGSLDESQDGSSDRQADVDDDLDVEELQPHAPSRLGSNTIQVAAGLLALTVVSGILEFMGLLGPHLGWGGPVVDIHQAFLLAAGLMNMACFMAALMERNAGGSGPTWFLGSTLGFLGTLALAQVAVVRVLKGLIDFL